jgi:hypothetical protein
MTRDPGSSGREQHAFRQQLPRDAAACGAERRPDAERERQHGNRGYARRLSHRPDAEPHILQQGSHGFSLDPVDVAGACQVPVAAQMSVSMSSSQSLMSRLQCRRHALRASV